MPLQDELDILIKMEEVFTKEQRDLIYELIEYMIKQETNYIEENLIHDAVIDVRTDIQEHRHNKNGIVLKPYKVENRKWI